MTDFRNVKLKELSREHSAAFQEAAFETGVRWAGGKQEVKRAEAKYLFIGDGLEPGLVWDNSSSVFEKSECKEILFTTPAYLKRSEEHTSELQSRFDLVCRLLLEKKKGRLLR